jgi:hypothetical protein
LRACEIPAWVELFRQDLQDGAGHGVAFKDLPEIRGSTAVIIVIPVVIGPDAILGGAQDFAAQDIEAEADEDIEFLLANPLEGVVREAMDEARGNRVHVHRFHVRQALRAVDPDVGVGRRIGIAQVPMPIQVEKETASQPAVTQRVDCLADQRPRRARFACVLRGVAVENEQLDRRKITFDNVIHNFGVAARQPRGVQKQTYPKRELSALGTPIERRVHAGNLPSCLVGRGASPGTLQGRTIFE